MHRYIHHMNELHAIFNKYFEKNESIHFHNTRQTCDLSFTVNSEIGKVDQT